MTPEFLLTSLLIIATPGTGAIYTVTAGLTGGTRSGLVAAAGCTLGIVPHMVTTISGLAALLQASALAFETLKYLGVAYLLYMAWAIFRDRNMLRVAEGMAAKADRHVVVEAILLNLLNPKLSIFFLAFLPQFVGANDASPLGRMLQLSAIFMGLTFVVFALYGAFAAAVRQHVLTNPKMQIWMRRGFAVAFAGLAVQLATARL